ncbi:MAG TPA: YdeI/OmpD-associated family protein [Gemmatimonadales bacterium]|jgi:uncharacterized protein YdeI (YjbR/CyaY-like superfamily)
MVGSGPRSFKGAAAFAAWLERHHASESELLVLLCKSHAAGLGLTYPDALDAALCYGWIDAVRKRVDDDRYTIRFTPRRPRSIWSKINLAHVARLTAAGRMAPAGLAAFAARTTERTGIYSYENAAAEFPPLLLKAFREHARAWKFFQAQPPSYRRQMTYRVVSAKREETRLRRLNTLIAASAAGRRLD